MKKGKSKAGIIWRNLMPVVGVLGIIAFWWIASAVYGNVLLFPSPINALKRAFELLGSSDFAVRMGNTFLSGCISFAFSYVVAVITAVFCKLTNTFGLVKPIISTVRAVPTITIILLVLLWVGAKTAPIIVASLVVFPTLYSMFAASLADMDKTLIEAVGVEGGGKGSIIKYGYLPHLHNSLIEGTASGLSLSLKLVVSAEAIAQTSLSIGAMMKQASAEFDPMTLFAAALMIAVVCIVIEWTVPFLDKKITKEKYAQA